MAEKVTELYTEEVLPKTFDDVVKQDNPMRLSDISHNMGDITAGSITLPESGWIKGGQTDYKTGDGFFFGYSGDAYKLSVGDSSSYLTFDGSEVLATDISVLTKYTAGENLDAGQALCLGRQIEVENDYGGHDAWVDQANPDTNYNGQATIKVARNADSTVIHSYVKFDITDFPDSVESVKYRFKVTAITSLVGIRIERVTADWDASTITWNNKAATAGNYGEQHITTVGWKEIDITDLYNLWKDGTYTNYGIGLTLYASSALPDICSISSTESAYSSNLFTDGLVNTDKVWATNGQKPFMSYNFVGFAKDTVSTGATIRVTAPYAKASGIQDEDLNDLVPGEKYYLSGTLLGYVVKEPSTYAYEIGMALTTSSLFVATGDKYAHGVKSISVGVDNSATIHSVGFRPSLIKISCMGDITGNQNLALCSGSGNSSSQSCIYGNTDESSGNRNINETYIGYLNTVNVSGDTTGDLSNIGKTTFTIDWTEYEEFVYSWEAFG